jgi:four helix bundle protein
MLIQNFEDAQVWQDGQELAKIVYQIFRTSKDYGFKDQIQRAAVSISNNIAEGFERQTNKELLQFLYISKGSCGETRSMINLAKKLGYINQEQFGEIYSLALKVSKMLGAFIKSCR